jgi:hypothetical protein
MAEEAMKTVSSNMGELLEKERESRKALEDIVRDLERKLVQQQSHAQQKATTELNAIRQNWQSKTRSLVAKIKHECDVVFDQELGRAITMSPNSPIAVEDTGNDGIASPSSDFYLDDFSFEGSALRRGQPTAWHSTRKVSRLDMSHVEETEAFVQSVCYDGNTTGASQ